MGDVGALGRRRPSRGHRAARRARRARRPASPTSPAARRAARRGGRRRAASGRPWREASPRTRRGAGRASRGGARSRGLSRGGGRPWPRLSGGPPRGGSPPRRRSGCGRARRGGPSSRRRARRRRPGRRRRGTRRACCLTRRSLDQAGLASEPEGRARRIRGSSTSSTPVDPAARCGPSPKRGNTIASGLVCRVMRRAGTPRGDPRPRVGARVACRPGRDGRPGPAVRGDGSLGSLCHANASTDETWKQLEAGVEPLLAKAQGLGSRRRAAPACAAAPSSRRRPAVGRPTCRPRQHQAVEAQPRSRAE